MGTCYSGWTNELIMTKEEAIENLMNTVQTPDGLMCLYGVLFQPDDGMYENTSFGCLFYKDGKLVSFWNTDVKAPKNLHKLSK